MRYGTIPSNNRQSRTNCMEQETILRKRFSDSKGEYRLKFENNADYCHVFFDALISYKVEVFRYVQAYYRCFMGKKSVTQ